MRIFIIICLLFIVGFAKADIPRADALKLSFNGETYYTRVCLEGLELKEGCVFDYNDEYVCEQYEYFMQSNSGIQLYTELVVLPYEKFWSERYSREGEDVEFRNRILIEAGEIIDVSGDDLRQIQFVELIVGEMAGRISSPNLSKSDESWIMDYELESIIQTGDGFCAIELFAIKGNVSDSEAVLIRARIDLLYKNYYNQNTEASSEHRETLEEIYHELLKRNIVMLGFCSC